MEHCTAGRSNKADVYRATCILLFLIQKNRLGSSFQGIGYQGRKVRSPCETSSKQWEPYNCPCLLPGEFPGYSTKKGNWGKDWDSLGWEDQKGLNFLRTEPWRRVLHREQATEICRDYLRLSTEKYRHLMQLPQERNGVNIVGSQGAGKASPLSARIRDPHSGQYILEEAQKGNRHLPKWVVS